MKKLVILTLALAVLLPAALIAGGQKEGAAGAAKEKTFAIVYPIVHPFFEPVTEVAVKYGKEKGVKVETYAPEGTLVDQQIKIMENLIAKKVNGIALCATDPVALTPYLDKARDAGIPVIAFESDMPESKRQGFLGTHNYRAGVHLGHVLAREVNYKGKSIICTGLPTQLSLNERIRGIKECLEKNYPDVKIVDLQTGQGDPALTLNVIEAQIQAHPDFDVFTSIDATGGPVAVSIWRAKGWKGDRHKIVTFDDMPENLAGIEEGIVNAVITQTQWTWGPKIVDALLALNEGKAILNYDDTGTIEITAGNVATYRQEKAWVYRFEK